MATSQASMQDPAKSADYPATQAQPAGPPASPQVPAQPHTASRASLAAIIAAQEKIFIDRQPESARLAKLATASLAGGVVSNWQISAPQPVWLSHGQGSKLYDVDGNEYVDLHGGYGVSLAGHGHPAIVRAVQAQVARGTHFAQPTENALAAAAELARRFGLPQWRFANSGTEATMDAVHLMRAITGRDLIIKVEGCYHGHHDSVQVSVCPDGEDDDRGPADSPRGVPSSSGIPARHHRPDAGRRLQRPGRGPAGAGRAPGPDRRHDPRADHDERRHHQARARLPAGAEGSAALPRRAADLRRGQDRPDRRTRRRDPVRRRHAGHRVPGQGHRRRRRGGRDRRHHRGHGAPDER